LLIASATVSACRTGTAASPDSSGSGNVSIVEATVVVSACPDAKNMNAKAARDAIRKLVDPCAAIPGGSAHFAATLHPDGRIELAAPSGDPAEGVVPTCVLRNKLAHKVLLRDDCKFDVKLDERPNTSAPPTVSSPR
jgi:hypothetical protein